jgi:protein SCO1
MSRTAFWLISIFLLACTGNEKTELPYYNEAEFTPMFLSRREAEQKVKHRIADFSFTDQQGRSFSNNDVDGKIHVANFFFTRCGSICPKMTNNLLAVQKEFAKDKDFVMVSYSVTPWQDSTEALNYLRISMV